MEADYRILRYYDDAWVADFSAWVKGNSQYFRDIFRGL